MNPVPQVITLTIPATWTAEQALAVFDLLDDLRDRIWAHYELPLRDLMIPTYQSSGPASDSNEDPPF